MVMVSLAISNVGFPFLSRTIQESTFGSEVSGGWLSIKDDRQWIGCSIVDSSCGLLPSSSQSLASLTLSPGSKITEMEAALSFNDSMAACAYL